jgi:hypothetical protein
LVEHTTDYDRNNNSNAGKTVSSHIGLMTAASASHEEEQNGSRSLPRTVAHFERMPPRLACDTVIEWASWPFSLHDAGSIAATSILVIVIQPLLGEWQLSSPNGVLWLGSS